MDSSVRTHAVVLHSRVLRHSQMLCAESSGKIFPAPGPLTIDKQSQPQAMPRLVFLPFNDSKLLRLESFE
jgi:hypothetical protein